jgi:hypothetical protein
MRELLRYRRVREFSQGHRARRPKSQIQRHALCSRALLRKEGRLKDEREEGRR